MNHLAISEWTPRAGNLYQSKTFESGVYCKFGTDEPLDQWLNPITGETRKVWQFYGGPFTVTVGPDGIVTKGATSTRNCCGWRRSATCCSCPPRRARLSPMPATPEKYPHLSAGKTIFWESDATYAAKLADAYDERLTSAPAFCTFQNMASWHPWLGMGGRAETRSGRTWGRAYGAKIASLDDIPAGARRALESHTPEIFKWREWQGFRNDIGDYVKTQGEG